MTLDSCNTFLRLRVFIPHFVYTWMFILLLKFLFNSSQSFQRTKSISQYVESAKASPFVKTRSVILWECSISANWSSLSAKNHFATELEGQSFLPVENRPRIVIELTAKVRVNVRLLNHIRILSSSYPRHAHCLSRWPFARHFPTLKLHMKY